VNIGKTIFAQLMDWLPKYEFSKCVKRYKGDFHVRSLPCYEQFLILAFAQLTYRESLRDIETCLRALGPKRYHSGFRSSIARSTLADANEKRDWRIFADFAQVLIAQAVDLYADEPLGGDLRQTAYALDSTTIDLCLSLFPWAKSRFQGKGEIKLHTLLNLQGSFPTIIFLTNGKIHDVNILDQMTFEPGAIYVLDRGYLDCSRLYRIHQSGAFFVTRAKSQNRFQRRYSNPVDKLQGVLFDQAALWKSYYPSRHYPDAIRRIGFRDTVTGKKLVFLTNSHLLPALTIANLFKCRWRIELFFKWIKQHLRIKAFCGNSENAVRVQIWVAMTVYVLIAIIRKRANLPHAPYTILQILSVTLFEKTPLLQVFSQYTSDEEPSDPHKQQYLHGILTGQ
jgi:hypothetical protein